MNNTNILGVRAVLDKKIEKNLLINVKYFYRDLIKKDKLDANLTFVRTIIYILIDKFTLLLIGNLDEQLITFLPIILHDFAKENSDIFNVYSPTLLAYNAVAKDKKDAAAATAAGIEQQLSEVFQ